MQAMQATLRLVSGLLRDISSFETHPQVNGERPAGGVQLQPQQRRDQTLRLTQPASPPHAAVLLRA